MRNNVKRTVLAILVCLLGASPAFAHEWERGIGGFGEFGGLGLGLGFGDHHGGFSLSDGLGLAFGLGFLDPERAQARFEDQFEALQTNYDEGVAGTTDFFNTDAYDQIVNKTERLDDHYGFFVSGVERSIDRLGDIISNTNDDIEFFNDLLANYQSDTDISPARLERIELFINRITDRLNNRVDSLTEKQTTLQTNLPTYQTFQTDISTFLSDIVTAGGGTSPTTTALTAMLGNSLKVDGAVASDMTVCDKPTSPLDPNAVPEPAALLLFVGGTFCALGSRRVRQAA
jgi:hypothetical protein